MFEFICTTERLTARNGTCCLSNENRIMSDVSYDDVAILGGWMFLVNRPFM